MATAQDYSLRKKVFAASWIVIFVAAGISAYTVFKASIKIDGCVNGIETILFA